MAVALGAVSVDHLDVSGPDELAALAGAATIAVPLPAAQSKPGPHRVRTRRALIVQAHAMATDLNPAPPCYSQPLVMAVAARYLHMLPAEALTGHGECRTPSAWARGIGSLDVGKQADLLILKERPTIVTWPTSSAATRWRRDQKRRGGGVTGATVSPRVT
ncbi:MAG: hypothetical protein R2838_03420 [Caldilineaceae bacterium]